MSVRMINLETEFRPAFDGIINGRYPSRVFDDGWEFANLWFELETGLFWCGSNRADAEDNRRRTPRSGVTLSNLRSHYGTRLTPVA
jgi:hypothetical protein